MNGHTHFRMSIAVTLLLAGGCANYSGEAAQLRSACSAGDKSACIDYDAMVKSCIAPMGLFPKMGCAGVRPQTVFHPDGAALMTASAPAANGATGTVSLTAVQAVQGQATTQHDFQHDLMAPP
jgi:hypothetical protein